MDFFKGIGDFFRGAFGGSDEDKKRKQQEEARRKQQQKVTQPKSNIGQPPAMQQPSNGNLDKPPTTQVTQPKQLFQTQPVAAPQAPIGAPPALRPTTQFKGHDLTGLSPEDTQTATKFINEGKDATRFIQAAKNSAAATAKSKYDNSLLGKTGNFIGEAVSIPVKFGIDTINDAGEQIADTIWQRKQFNEANKALADRTGDKGLYADPAYQKSRRAAIDEAEKSKAIDSTRAKQLRDELEANISRASQAAKEIRQESKDKYGRDIPGEGEMLANTALAASNLAVGGGASLKLVGKELVDASAQRVLPQLVKQAEKIAGRQLNRLEFDAIVQKVKQLEDDVAQQAVETVETNLKPGEVTEEAVKEAVPNIQKQSSTRPNEVVQVVNPETGDKTFYRIPDSQRDDIVKSIDGTSKGIAGHNIGGAVTHVTARTPEDMAARGFKDGGVYTPGDLADSMKSTQTAVDDAVEGQVANIDEAAQARQQANEEVRGNQEVAGAPAQGEPTPPVSSSPEVQANNAYASQYNNTFDMTDEILRQADVDTSKGLTQESGLKKFFHKATGGIISDPYKEMVDKIRDSIHSKAYDMAASGNVFSQAPGKIATLFGNNAVLQDGLRQIIRIRNDAQSAAGDAVKRLHDTISDKVAQLNIPPEQFNQLLDRIFETPEFLARKYGDSTKIAIDSLPPAEREIVDKLIEANKLRNLSLFRQGKISQGEYQMFADGMHSPRLYDFEKQGLGSKGNKLIDTTATKKRKDLGEISDETFDKLIESPAQRMLIRLEMAMRSNASDDALRAFDEAGMLLDRAPNNQFSKLEGARWGNYQGKYVYNPIRGQLEDGIIMDTKTGQTIQDLIDQYRNSPFGKVDRFFKKTKTVYSPGTFIGNVASNPLLFNTGAGVNPIGQSARMVKAGKDLVEHRTGKAFNADIYEAQKYGVFSSDTGRQITGRNNPTLSVANNKRTNPLEAAYGGVDDAAKLAIWRTLRGRGVEPELAARRVSQFTQDYNNAGRLVQTLADMPIVGRPFARFAPELVRLVKNNVIYNPVGMVAGAGALAMLQHELSQNAGETPEEREARETAMGQSLIPGTAWLNKMTTGTDRDISLNFPVDGTAVNIARAVGLNFPQDESGNPNMALIKSLVPWAIPFRENAQGEQVFSPEELFTSLAWSPVAQQIANRDFMGREITDPTNKTYYEDGDNSVRKFSGDNPDATMERAKHLAMSYVPLANEIGAVGSALLGKDDYYGKTRSVPEALARMFGFKTESNDEAARQKRIDTKQYFEEDLKAVQDFVTQNPDLADAYFKYRNPTRNRVTNQKESDLVSPERWDIINTDTSGRLFNFLKSQAVKQNQEDGKPLDPIFRLPDDQAKYVTELRSRPTGDDEEAKDILRATSNWYEKFENDYFNYLDANSKYFDSLPKYEGAADENPRVTAYGEASAPVVMPDVIKEYYRIKEQDPDRAKEVYKANKDLLSTAFDQYASDKLDRINKLRKIEGYEPISLETYKNKTFGFDIDGSGFGFGSGGGGKKEVNTLGELSNFSNGIKGLDTEAPVQELPNTVALFQKLMAGRGGGRSKPRLGASSRGQ